MNCPKCSTPAAAGATHCRRCGAALTAKTAAPSAVPEVYDLLPEEPKKEPAFSPYEDPTAPGAAPSADAGPGTKSRKKSGDGTKARPKPEDGPSPEVPADVPENVRNYKPPVEEKESKTGLMISGVVLAIFVLFIGWRMLRPKHELVTGTAKVDSSATLNPNQVFLKPIEIVGTWKYTLEVNALDSEISVGVFKKSAKDRSTLADLKKLPEGFETAGKGDPFTKSGELTTGAYAWVLVNEGKKPARVKFKFLAE
jgi:hypothetical protein